MRPFHATYLPGPRWYRWWDFGNGTMSDLGGHDNDVVFQVLDIRYPLTIEAVSPMGKAHPELAPATMTVTYEFPARGSHPPLKLVWYQGEGRPPQFDPRKMSDRGQLFLGDNLDADRIQASYHNGVLRLSIPVAEKAKPRRIKIASSDEKRSINA